MLIISGLWVYSRSEYYTSRVHHSSLQCLLSKLHWLPILNRIFRNLLTYLLLLCVPQISNQKTVGTTHVRSAGPWTPSEPLSAIASQSEVLMISDVECWFWCDAGLCTNRVEITKQNISPGRVEFFQGFEFLFSPGKCKNIEKWLSFRLLFSCWLIVQNWP